MIQANDNKTGLLILVSVKKQVLINHPMLGSKKPMTNESKNEQTSAGLNQLTNSEEEVMDVYNKR